MRSNYRILKGLVIVTIVIAMLVAAAPPLNAVDAQTSAAATKPMTIQLRIYTIDKGRLNDFAEAWRHGVYPLRQKFGFEIPSAWTIEATNQFVWVLQYPGTEEAWKARDAAYYASAERKALQPDPAQWIARAEQYFVNSVVR